MTTFIDDESCSTADLHGAASFQLVITPANETSSIVAPFRCDLNFVSVVLPFRKPTIVSVKAYGYDAMGTVVLAGSMSTQLTPFLSNTLSLHLLPSDGNSGWLRVKPVKPLPESSGDLCIATNQPQPSVALSDRTQTLSIPLNCRGSTDVQLRAGKWAMSGSTMNSPAQTINIALGERTTVDLPYKYDAPIFVPFDWTFRWGTRTLSCAEADAGTLTISSPDFESQVLRCGAEPAMQHATVRFDHATRAGTYHFSATWSGGWSTFNDVYFEPGAHETLDGGTVHLVSFRNE